MTDQFLLRLPDGMREKLKALAEGNRRSMNAEIVARLEESIERDKPSSKDQESLKALAERVIARLTEELKADKAE